MKELRQRGVGLIGAIIAMVIAGLIVYGIIYYGSKIGGGGLLQDISEHPERYIGKEVTVEGYVCVLSYRTTIFENEICSLPDMGSVYQKNPLREVSNYYLMLKFSDNSGAAEVVNFAKYRLTGIVQKEATLVMLIVSRVEPT